MNIITHNHQLQLMVPNQANKDVVFNEALLKIDSFLCSAATGFRDLIPTELSYEEKYITPLGIVFKAYDRINTLKIYEKMVIYVIEEGAFFIFNSGKWEKVISAHIGIESNQNSSETLKFQGVKGKYLLSGRNKIFYLYVENDCSIAFDVENLPQKFTVLIKQHYQLSRKIIWQGNILWPEYKEYKTTNTPNAMDIIEFYRLPETEHFLGKVIGKNYQF